MLHVRRIVAPVDFSDHSRRALDHAIELGRQFGAEVELLHVLEDPSLPSFYAIGAQALYGKQPDLETAAREALEKEVADRREEVPVQTYLVHDDAARGIVDFAEEREADLIVIASHGLTGLQHLVMGSVAERVVRRSQCPVLVVKAFGRSLIDGKGPVEPS